EDGIRDFHVTGVQTCALPISTAVARINASGLPCLALDIPSGLCADTGRLWGAAVRADLTVTFIALKLGLFTGAGPDQVGELCFRSEERRVGKEWRCGWAV